MSKHDDKPYGDEFDAIVDCLLDKRAQLEPIDLDRLELQILGRGTSHQFAPGPVRRRILAPVLAVGLMGGGTAAALAGGGDDGSKPPSSCSQYKSNGKPKTCKPKTQKPPNGDNGHGGNGNGDKGGDKGDKNKQKK
jgi:hypothetical protein